MLKIGFIGVGIIATALVKGLLAEYGNKISISLSPRNALRAAALAAEFDNVQVLSSNQEVLDSSDWIILAVLPRNAEEILSPLAFSPDHKVISLVSDFTVKQMQALIGPTASFNRMVPLPFVAHRIGPLALYPDSGEIQEIFGNLGDIVPATDEKELDLLVVITALMSPFYATLGDVISWGERKGLSTDLAVHYTISFFAALLHQAKTLPVAEVSEIWKEATPGGLNELAVKHIQSSGALTAWEEAMDKVLARIRPNN